MVAHAAEELNGKFASRRLRRSAGHTTNFTNDSE
jgi:hypothetical protein